MKEAKSLKEEIEFVIQKNHLLFKRKSNLSMEKLKELRFKEIKNILVKFNKDYLFNN